ncbi:hypothetical protein PYW08_016235 [Mythimna loreyi]|uniref:Uncharacterized protein n=1 Tax=Mythimna loreyi TaxID=667449 RepID=A0ACC2QYG2_9NEOP|nr:hypothetical protein PYW08_016235 [Mythimna loreyi]
MVKDVLEKAELELYVQESIPNVTHQRFKLHYHVTPPVGWMNAPNGFIFYKGQYHLFYQYYPYDTQWGPMHWGHVVSPDLVNWELLPTALRPGNEQCFSGSATQNEGILVLFYTAHEPINKPPYYSESQNMAFSFDGINFQKYKENPVSLYPPKGAVEFRDPKIWKNGNYWYVILGSKSEDYKGMAFLYRSKNMTSWHFKSVLAKSCGQVGHMWENPDFFEINGKFILLISPKGIINKGDRFKNTYQTGYVIGSFNYDTCKFKPETYFQEIDFGHDFYATQTTEHNGKRYLIAWFGMWDSAHPEDAEGWVGAMTLVRELDLIGSRLLMRPVEAITKLRQKNILQGEFKHNSILKFEKTAEIIVDVDLLVDIELEIVGAYGGDQITVRWNATNDKVMVIRSGDVRQVKWRPLDAFIWRIFLDASSLELFCGDGEVVFSSRIYPSGDWRVINRSRQSLYVLAYTLERSIYKNQSESTESTVKPLTTKNNKEKYLDLNKIIEMY